MISTENITLAFGGRTLFEDVNIKFTPGNCYGLIGANGAGKSTFLRVLSGEQESTSGSVIVPPGFRVSTLKQDHSIVDDLTALQAVIRGHDKLYAIMKEKDEIYAKPDFSDEDGIRAAELEADFADMNGWDAEANAGALLEGLGIPTARHDKVGAELEDNEKVRVLLAQALFGNPDILLLDEPTNHLDIDTILWLEDFLYGFKNTVIVVSHDRHFLDRVCTHIADVDFQKVKLYSGNYTFWYETSQMALRQRQASNQAEKDKMLELQAFIRRFSANASKSKQATSRKSLLAKITLDDIKPSSRKYPYIVFKTERPLKKEVLFAEGLTKTMDGEVLFKDLTFTVGKDERIALVGGDRAVTALFDILAGDLQPDEGTITYGRSVNLAYFPKESAHLFNTESSLLGWLRQYTEDSDEEFVRGFLGRMLFSGDEVHKPAKVLSGGEKVRCLLSRMMLQDPNMLLLDGPTNHLDLESITALNNGLLSFEGSMIFATHDVQFAQSLCDRIIEIAPDTHFDLRMEYDDYLADEARRARRGLPV